LSVARIRISGNGILGFTFYRHVQNTQISGNVSRAATSSLAAAAAAPGHIIEGGELQLLAPLSA
jgi:hypothetical protein